jgi:hypothetical protein
LKFISPAIGLGCWTLFYLIIFYNKFTTAHLWNKLEELRILPKMRKKRILSGLRLSFDTRSRKNWSQYWTTMVQIWQVIVQYNVNSHKNVMHTMLSQHIQWGPPPLHSLQKAK